MRSNDGCWTCKLRKKRCDESKPACRNCSTLEITCNFDAQRPSWMDNGPNQKQKTAEIKHEVKAAAARRRGMVSMNALDPTAAEFDGEDGLTANSPGQQLMPPIDSITHHEEISDYISVSAPMPTPPNSDLVASHIDQNHWNSMNWSPAGNFSDRRPEGLELDRRFLMFYFDHFFPFLFPFYKPPLLEGGRSWIMELVVYNQAMWHTTLCLSSYFVSVAFDGAISEKTLCKSLAWDKLLKQMNITFQMLQHDLHEVTSNDTPKSIVKASRIMGSIIQLQRFEISIGNSESCQQHLGAAITLFQEIFHLARHDGDGYSMTTLSDVLGYMGRPLWAINSQPSGGAWSSDQAAFRFYTALLIVDDIVASTCTSEPPRLIDYHASALANDRNSDAKPLLNLQDFVGCENWVMLQISEISALDAWKSSMKKAGQLDMMELVARASGIKSALVGNLARLDATVNAPKANPLGLFAVYNDQLPYISGGCNTFVTRVWAHAALLYLSVAVSGWQPASAGIRENVIRILALLDQMPAPELLRTMVWPYCLSGCLAEPHEENRFRAMADALVPYRLFGAGRKALEIMENVWKCRGELSIDTDFSACVSSLGYISLLV
ncbi:unnamed protein product [Periconia digitata]|uniref:Zn(2)-C6 fungal-type domain-containing protein n=1 Tax=Periconia digitata TaxID=1303443 RepID=A0A9W4XRV6_9PLEO|nr:unnamed protein product [Periconia digitata]